MPNNNVYNKNTDKTIGENITLPKTTAQVGLVEEPALDGDAKLPEVKPEVGTVPSAVGTNVPTATTNATPNNLTNNDTAWANGYASYQQYINNIKDDIAGNATTALTGSEYDALLKQYGITPESAAGIKKTVAEGTAGADEDLLTDTGYALIQALKAEYANLMQFAQQAEIEGKHEEAAQYRAQMQQINDTANRVRAGAGYYGSTDGSMYITRGELGIGAGGQQNPDNAAEGGGTADGASNTPEARMKALLDEWKTVAQEQYNGQIDFAVAQAVKELERALEDAQPQFKEQSESISLDERQTMDNTALYAELRGDKGGIGQEQYSSIQNTAAQNRLAVQQAQTKLATDTARQIEDLRAQGEFDKADVAFEITQEYLAKLVELEQWAAQYNMSVEQFNASLKQWEAEYELTLEKLGISQEQWAAEMALKEKQYDYDAYLNSLGLAHTEQSELAEVGWAMLKLGIVPDQRYLEAMKMDTATAQQLVQALGNSGTEVNDVTEPGEIYRMLYEQGYLPEDKERILVLLTHGGMDIEQARLYYNAYANGEYEALRMDAYDWGDGLDTEQPRWQESSEWDLFYAMVESRLKNGNYAGVEQVVDRYKEQLSREQYVKICRLFEKYDFTGYDFFGE